MYVTLYACVPLDVHSIFASYPAPSIVSKVKAEVVVPGGRLFTC